MQAGRKIMKQVATYETVAAACEQLKEENQNVTGRAVMAITGGSLGTVLKLIKQWRNNVALNSTNATAEIPKELQTAIIRAIGLAQNEAVEKLKETVEQSDSRESEALVALAQAEKRIDQLTKELETSLKRVEEVQAEAEKESAVAAEKNDTLTRRVEELKNERKQLIEAAELSRTEAAKALLQVERADQATEKAERVSRDLNIQCQEVLNQKVEIEKKLAVLSERNKTNEESLSELRNAYAQLSEENKSISSELQKENDGLRAANTNLEKQFTEINVKNEILEQQLREQKENLRLANADLEKQVKELLLKYSNLEQQNPKKK